MSAITTHILDVSAGVPARGVPIVLERQSGNDWEIIGEGETDADGRLRDLLDADFSLQTGNYRLVFDAENYFQKQQTKAFYAQITIAFVVRDTAQHYHVPLLLSPFGYSTYRGS